MNGNSNQQCVCCGSNKISPFLSTSFLELPVLKCENCSYYFLKYDTNAFDIKKYYSDTYWTVFRNLHNKKKLVGKVDTIYLIKKLPKPIRNLIEWTGVRKSLAYSQFNYIKPYIKGKKLLEIGSGEGFLLELFEKNGFNVFGIEPSKDNLPIIKQKLNRGTCVTGYVEDLSTLKEKFDLIILSHVFEHIIDCKQTLIELQRLLGNDGIIFIEVPNCENKETLEHSIHTQPHIHHFSQNNLEQLVHNCGYSVIKTDVFKADVLTISQHFQYMLKWFLKMDHYTKTDRCSGNNIRLIIMKSNN